VNTPGGRCLSRARSSLAAAATRPVVEAAEAGAAATSAACRMLSTTAVSSGATQSGFSVYTWSSPLPCEKLRGKAVGSCCQLAHGHAGDALDDSSQSASALHRACPDLCLGIECGPSEKPN
jgi:hypothetical protein